jgi:hypothetical protein
MVGCVYESNLPDEPEIELTYEQALKQSIFHVDNSRIKLKNLELTDGISFDEANTILDNFYLSGKAGGCGAPGNIVDNGEQWKAATFVGIAAKRSYPIYIDKKTGAIKQNNEILIANPKTLIFKDPVYYIEAIMQIKKNEEYLQKNPNKKLQADAKNAQRD